LRVESEKDGGDWESRIPKVEELRLRKWEDNRGRLDKRVGDWAKGRGGEWNSEG
jgi:hypothetical protein